MSDCEKILSWLEEDYLSLSGSKFSFGMLEVMIVSHLCGWFGQKLDLNKMDAIKQMKDMWILVIEVQRFLGACVFYHVLISHFVHKTNPLYDLLQKGKGFNGREGIPKQCKN